MQYKIAIPFPPDAPPTEWTDFSGPDNMPEAAAHAAAQWAKKNWPNAKQFEVTVYIRDASYLLPALCMCYTVKGSKAAATGEGN